MNRKEIEIIKNTDAIAFTFKVIQKPEKCYFCNSKNTWELIVGNDKLTECFFYRPIDGRNRAICTRHHFIMVKLDNFVSQLYKILFKYLKL